MSTHATVDLHAQREAEHRAAEELRQRRLAAFHLHVKQLQAETEQMGIRIQQSIYQAQQAPTRTGALQTDLHTIERNLMQTLQLVDLSQKELQAARSSNMATADQIAALQSNLDQAIADGRMTLHTSQTTVRQGQAMCEELGLAWQLTQQAKREWDKRQASLEQLQQEINFLIHDPTLLVPAVATLLTMSTNGYALTEIRPDKGLIAYFEKADRSHKIAVRSQSASQSAAKSLTQWEMEVETFGVAGDQCLDVLDDFIEGSERTKLVDMQVTKRTYPKPEGIRVFLPLPSEADDLTYVDQSNKSNSRFREYE